jgi:hypothetical protein
VGGVAKEQEMTNKGRFIMGKKIDFTLPELNEMVDEAEKQTEKKRRDLFQAECDLIESHKRRALYCCPFDPGEEFTLSKDGEVTAGTGKSLGCISEECRHLRGSSLRVDRIEALPSPPYYSVKVRKKTKGIGGGYRWSVGSYQMPYPDGVGYWKGQR